MGGVRRTAPINNNEMLLRTTSLTTGCPLVPRRSNRTAYDHALARSGVGARDGGVGMPSIDRREIPSKISTHKGKQDGKWCCPCNVAIDLAKRLANIREGKSRGQQ